MLRFCSHRILASRGNDFCKQIARVSVLQTYIVVRGMLPNVHLIVRDNSIVRWVTYRGKRKKPTILAHGLEAWPNDG